MQNIPVFTNKFLADTRTVAFLFTSDADLFFPDRVAGVVGLVEVRRVMFFPSGPFVVVR